MSPQLQTLFCDGSLRPILGIVGVTLADPLRIIGGLLILLLHSL